MNLSIFSKTYKVGQIAAIEHRIASSDYPIALVL